MSDSVAIARLASGLEEIVDRNGPESAAWAFAARWAADWLGRARRLAPPSASRLSIVLGRACQDELDLDVPYIRALELFCMRAGVKVLSLPARAINGIGDAVSVHRPDLVILAGGQLDDDTVTRWAYLIGRSVGPRPLALYRSTSTQAASTVLPPAPGEAQLRLIELATAVVPTPVRPLARQRLTIGAASSDRPIDGWREQPAAERMHNRPPKPDGSAQESVDAAATPAHVVKWDRA